MRGLQASCPRIKGRHLHPVGVLRASAIYAHLSFVFTSESATFPLKQIVVVDADLLQTWSHVN